MTTLLVNPVECTLEVRRGRRNVDRYSYDSEEELFNVVAETYELGDDIILAGAKADIVDVLRENTAYRVQGGDDSCLYDHEVMWSIQRNGRSWIVLANDFPVRTGSYRKCLDYVGRKAEAGEPVTVCQVEYLTLEVLERDSRIFKSDIRHLLPGTSRMPLGVLELVANMR